MTYLYSNEKRPTHHRQALYIKYNLLTCLNMSRMSKIQFSLETFKQYTHAQQTQIINLAQSLLDNSFDIDIITSLPNGGFLVKKGNDKIAICGAVFAEFVVCAVNEFEWDYYNYWIDTWKDDNEVAYNIALIIECERIACQIVERDQVEEIPTQQGEKAANMWDSIGWPTEAELN